MQSDPALLIACDFDGTVTAQDTLVEILTRYGAPDWRQVQDRVVEGQISIRQALEAEMGSVQANLQELTALLSSKITLEPSFPHFFKKMQSKGIPVVLISGGFDLCVETVMAKAGIWPIPFLANRLMRTNGSWSVEFPYASLTCTECGHCKGDPIRTWKTQGYTTVFVGNGVTDRCGAQAADLTFAKDELSHWCRRQGIPAVAYKDFNDITEELQKRAWL